MNYKNFDIKLNSVLKNPSEVLSKYNKQKQRRLAQSDIANEFVDILQSKNLEIQLIDLFRLDRLQTYPIHIDNNHICDFPRMNFVYGNTQCPMIWYKLISSKPKELTEYFDQKIMLFNPNEVVEVERTMIQKSAIVQTGQPHTVIHRGIGTRWAVSFIFKYQSNHLSFTQLCDLFTEYPD